MIPLTASGVHVECTRDGHLRALVSTCLRPGHLIHRNTIPTNPVYISLNPRAPFLLSPEFLVHPLLIFQSAEFKTVELPCFLPALFHILIIATPHKAQVPLILSE